MGNEIVQPSKVILIIHVRFYNFFLAKAENSPSFPNTGIGWVANEAGPRPEQLQPLKNVYGVIIFNENQGILWKLYRYI